MAIALPPEHVAYLRRVLNPLERLTGVFTGVDDRQDLTNALLAELILLLSGGQPGPGPAPSGGFRLAARVHELMHEIGATTTEVILPQGALADARGSLGQLVIVKNDFNQAVTADIIGHTAGQYSAAAHIIQTIAVPTLEARAYGLKHEEWYPYLGVRVTPVVAPTAGSVSASAILQEPA